jgi:hypothetical protein
MMQVSERCLGSFKTAENVKNMSHLGSKFFGKYLGECSTCGRNVNVVKGKTTAHKKH